MSIVKFLEKKPVVNKVNNKLVFSTYSQNTYSEKDDFDTKYEIITKDLTEAKAFKGYTRLEKVDNTIKAYQSNQLKDNFIIDLDNSIYKIVNSVYKVDIINIEKDQFILENVNVNQEIKDIEFDEPYVAAIPYEKESFLQKIINKFLK